jgi:hypothetical protein
MFDSFEIKSYPQLNFTLSIVNGFLLFVTLVIARFAVLSFEHRQALGSVLDRLINNPWIELSASLGLFALLAVLWGWVSTTFIRVHDRIHEPFFVKWRAGYDTDLILRSLCYDQSVAVSPELFERAYSDKRIRGKLMQRLFYCFGGDAEPHEGLRIRFYTAITKYWVLATVEIYALLALVVFSSYHIATLTTPSPYVVLIITAFFVLARICANRVLDEVRPITAEQVGAIRRDDAAQLSENLAEVAREFGGRGQYE